MMPDPSIALPPPLAGKIAPPKKVESTEAATEPELLLINALKEQSVGAEKEVVLMLVEPVVVQPENEPPADSKLPLVT